MKRIKMYERFITKKDESYINTRMEELSELVKNYSFVNKFEYELDSDELEVTMVLDDEHEFEGSNVLEILYDINFNMLGVYLGHEEDFRVSSVEEALDIIEKKIYSYLGVSENNKN